jgi:hypothetical protein
MMRIPLVQRVGGLPVVSAAIQRESRTTFVFVRTGPQQFVRRSIRSGDERRDRTLVLGGLREHDEVVIQGAVTLNALWNLREKGRTHA